MKKTFLICATVLSLAAASALAAPVDYDEATDGDLGFSPFALNVGLNTITGTAVQGDRDDFGLTFDSSALKIVGGTFTATNTGGNGNYNSSAVPVEGGGIFQGVLGGGNTDISFLGGFGSGSVFRVSAGSTSDITYTFTFEVAAVPLPASGLMLLAGLGGVAALRRRKARG